MTDTQDHPPAIRLEYASPSTRTPFQRLAGLFFSISFAAVGVVLTALGINATVELFLALHQPFWPSPAFILAGAFFCFVAMRIQKRFVFPAD